MHFAEQRAAPYSMIDRAHAVYTQTNNVVGNLNLLYAIAEINPDIHLVKLGTMGEYGTPNIDIEEGWLEITHNGRTDRMLYPKRPGSFYHLSKVHDSHNIEFACRIWGLRATDLNQGVVYGQQTDETARDERLATRFDYDAVFGTVLNRFVILAALGQPLTVYGDGGQTRGMIDIRDTVECIRLACENPAAARRVPGVQPDDRVRCRCWTSRSWSPTCTRTRCQVEHLTNPRVELETHYYNVTHTGLVDLGLQPHLLSDTLLTSLYEIADPYKHRADLEAMRPRSTGEVPCVPTDRGSWVFWAAVHYGQRPRSGADERTRRDPRCVVEDWRPTRLNVDRCGPVRCETVLAECTYCWCRIRTAAIACLADRAWVALAR